MDRFLTLSNLLLFASLASAETEVERLRRDLDAERRARTLLEQRLAALESSRPATGDAMRREIEAYLAEREEPAPKSRGLGDLIALSVVLDMHAGVSTASDEALASIALGDHDPKVRGFNVRNEELVVTADVDPYFFALLDVVLKIDEEGESSLELEEAYALTTSLPASLQLKVGQFFTDFGRVNPLHPHAWEFHNRPVMLGRVLGGDGWRGQGARLSWIAPTLPLTLLAGAQNARGETQAAFLGEEGGEIGDHTQLARSVRSPADLAYHARAEATHEFGQTSALIGLSFGTGPNATGPDAVSRLYGFDLHLKWQPPATDAGWPFVAWQSEFALRDFEADAQDGVAARRYRDWGLYTQVVWAFRRPWTVALRLDHASSDGAFAGDHDRLSVALTYVTSEFARIRLQVAYDELRGLALAVPGASDGNWSLWLGFSFSLGKHGAHRY